MTLYRAVMTLLCSDCLGTQPIPKEVPYHPKGAVTVANKPSWVWREVRHHREYFERLASMRS